MMVAGLVESHWACKVSRSMVGFSPRNMGRYHFFARKLLLASVVALTVINGI